jgi:hypothetical protein
MSTEGYILGGAGQAQLTPPAVVSLRAPTTSDVRDSTGTPYLLGQIWYDSTSTAFYIYQGAGVWVLLSSSSGSIESLISGSGTATPTAGAVTIAGTPNQITTTASGSTLTISVPSTFVAPGSITATSGAITATNGNLVLGTGGNKILSTSVATTTTAGANSFGSVTLVGGTATVATTAVTASSLIFIWRQSVGSTGNAALGMLSVGAISAATNFVINAWEPTSATTLQATDVSVVGWMIVN